MQSEVHGAVAPPRPDAAQTVEIELALELQEPSAQNFETCVRNAAEVVGGEILFDMPADGSIDDASRITAIRVPGPSGDLIVFAILDGEEQDIRIADRNEVGERFHGFAQAFVGVLERIRDDIGRRGSDASPPLDS